MFYFNNIWDVILPIDFHIIQDGYCTASQSFVFVPQGTPMKSSCVFPHGRTIDGRMAANDGRWQPLTGFIKVEIWRKSPLMQPGKGGFFGKTMWFFNPSLWFYDGISWDILLDMDLSSYGYLVVHPT